MADHVLAVVFGEYDAGAILEAVRRHDVRAEVEAIVARYVDEVREDAARLRIALREIVEGPCREAEQDARGEWVRRPLLLVIDDFERVLIAPAGGRHRVEPGHVDAVRAVIEAFDGADTASRLLFTSRYLFTLPHGGRELGDQLLHVQLAPMNETEGEKQAAAKTRGRQGAGSVHPERAKRCVRAARGNPGLQDLLFVSAMEAPEACDRTLEALEKHLGEQADVGADQEELWEFLQGLAIEELVGLLTPGEKALLRASTLFKLPAPLDVLVKLARTVGVPEREVGGERLFAMGLWDRHDDVVAVGEEAALPNPLVRPGIDVLTGEEENALAELIIEPLLRGWGGEDGSRRSHDVDVELTRLGVAGSMRRRSPVRVETRSRGCTITRNIGWPRPLGRRALACSKR